MTRIANGCIVTESESNDAQVFANLRDPLSDLGQRIIVKSRKALQRRTRCLRAKAIAES